MKFRIKEIIFSEVHMFSPQVKVDSIREGYELNVKCIEDPADPNWCFLSYALPSFQEAKDICDGAKEIQKERQVIIHELPERT